MLRVGNDAVRPKVVVGPGSVRAMALAGCVGQLVGMGWKRETLAFFHSMPKEEIQEMLPLASKDWTDEDYEVLLREAKRQRRWMDVEDNQFYLHQRLLYKDVSVIDAKIANLPAAVAEAGVTLALARKALPRVTWKTRLQKALAGAAGEQQRAKVEEAERERWIKELLKLLEDAGFLGSTAKNPEAMKHLAARCAMGRRASTLRQHVKYGRKVQVYIMESIYGVAWLRGYMDFIGYVSLLLEEPCGRSVPSSLFKAIAFMELASEVPDDKRISTTQAVHNYLMEVSKGNTWSPHQRVKAARIPLEVARAWEQGVLDVSLQKFKRVYCWYKLLKLWGALRSHDAEGVPPATLVFDEAVGLQGDIVRGKTTGIGRRVEVVQFFVSKDAWLISREWLRVGLELFMSMNRDTDMGNRDFLMCKPAENLHGFRKAMMRYPDAMCFSRALLTELYSTRQDEKGDLYRIMIPESTSYWSEHSERVTIMSWALIAEIPRETRRRWGRWSPGVDEEYAVTTKRVVTAAHGALAAKIRAQYGLTDFVDDKSVLNGFSLWLQTVFFKTVSESHQEAMKIAPPMWGGIGDGPVKVVKKPQQEPIPDESIALDSPTEVFSDDEGMDDIPPGERFPLGTFILSVVGRAKRRTLHIMGGCYCRNGAA